jgi:hypothetical protein
MEGFLLLILIWLAPSVEIGTSTESHQPKLKFEYSNVLIERWVLIQQLRDRLYGKPEGKIQAKTQHCRPSVPDAEQASPNPEMQRWRQRKRKHHPAASRTARGVSSALRKQNLRGGYHLAYTGTQTKRQMYQTSYRRVHHGDCL